MAKFNPEEMRIVASGESVERGLKRRNRLRYFAVDGPPERYPSGRDRYPASNSATSQEPAVAPEETAIAACMR